eukprot:TRINITY_DN79890_c0_g1_i1.p1 TRINITY_DN79890_c0_g1~~TRINITY_DN79890_c0_g1_i1.p1  ORF type:complete len:173 (+),score=36.91 TRINITY_DN79890_c0_g1_i1:76-594(+)
MASSQIVAVVTASLVLMSLATTSTAVKSPCGKDHFSYTNTSAKAKLLTASIADSKACQEQCNTAADCTVWTYYGNTNACWLFGKDTNPTEKKVEKLEMKAVSGPKICPTVVTDAVKVVSSFWGKDSQVLPLKWPAWAWSLLSFGVLGGIALITGLYSYFTSDRGGKVKKGRK